MNAGFVKRPQSPNAGAIWVDRDGKRYYGEWRLENGMLRVSGPELGFKETKAKGGNAAVEGLARVLLDELAAERTFRKSG
jgi:hypothetical protein